MDDGDTIVELPTES